MNHLCQAGNVITLCRVNEQNTPVIWGRSEIPGIRPSVPGLMEQEIIARVVRDEGTSESDGHQKLVRIIKPLVVPVGAEYVDAQVRKSVREPFGDVLVEVERNHLLRDGGGVNCKARVDRGAVLVVVRQRSRDGCHGDAEVFCSLGDRLGGDFAAKRVQVSNDGPHGDAMARESRAIHAWPVPVGNDLLSPVQRQGLTMKHLHSTVLRVGH